MLHFENGTMEKLNYYMYGFCASVYLVLKLFVDNTKQILQAEENKSLDGCQTVDI
jgi:hypothetical protein